ncbi:hypothetical protein BJX66DRAFT_97004 [Aspergillus keveii]|uniref:Uncharacterized protein n=1 Tax=Aspergillus keveii TaxID=714993 RepID=A0ABR4FLB7_9EURO
MGRIELRLLILVHFVADSSSEICPMYSDFARFLPWIPDLTWRCFIRFFVSVVIMLESTLGFLFIVTHWVATPGLVVAVHCILKRHGFWEWLRGLEKVSTMMNPFQGKLENDHRSNNCTASRGNGNRQPTT